MKNIKSIIKGIPIGKRDAEVACQDLAINSAKYYFVLLLALCFSLNSLELTAQAFDSSNLDFSGFPGVNNATSLEFGPDGNLYVAEEDGLVKVYTIQRNGIKDYSVTAAEVLTLVQSIPNHDDDDGAPGGPSNRQVTGITVAGTATNPIVYVSSSDRRRGAGGGGGDVNLDTNSGVITRLTKNGSGNWIAVDMVRGLPRSEENHATNGMQFQTIGGNDWLIVSSGGFTNAGSPSNNFAFITEYALSGAVLAIDITALELLPIKNDGSRNYIYDIPTLDDPTRSNVDENGNPASDDPDDPTYSPIDVNDPWGGNDGLNMGMLVTGSPVKMFSPGYRNTYDLVITTDGHVYVTDNGANGGWGGYPEYEGDASQVNNNYRPGEPGSTGSDQAPNSTPFDAQVNNSDHLNLVSTDINSYAFGSVYGGHPCPVRANENAGLFTRGSHSSGGFFTDSFFRTQKFDPNGSTPNSETDPQKALPANWPPVDVSLLNPDNADFRQPTLTPGQNPDGPDDIIVVNWSNNSNGIAEYTASNFGGIMKGDLVAGKGSALHRVDRDPNTGAILGFEESKFSVSGNALGVDTRGDGESFPGTIWVANYNGDAVVILEPNDFVICILPGETGYDPLGDNDSDGYTNDDELQNGSDLCSGASQPSDFDNDLVSDLLDLDDDNDGINDNADALQLGSAVDLPADNEFFLGTDLGGYLGLGFTGLMNNGDPNPNYLDWQDDPAASDTDVDDILGGAIGAVTMYQTTGDASNNTQEKAYQFGINVDNTSGSFTLHGRMFPPFHNFSATESQGMFIGDGFQDDYVKIVIGQNYQLSVVGENNATPVSYISPTAVGFTPDPTTSNFDLYFVVDSGTGNVQARYSIDDGPINDLGTPFTLQGDVLNSLQSASPLVVGIIGTADIDDGFAANWDFLKAAGSVPFVSQVLEDLNRFINDPQDVIGLDSYFGDDEGTTNLTYSIESNTDPQIGAVISGDNLTLTYPGVAATSDITIRATDSDNFFVEQTFSVSVTDAPVVLFRVNAGDVLIAATDAPNPDWAANTGTGAQSGTGFSVNTGNISTHNIPNSDSSVPAYAPQALFANERWDPGAAPEMEWAFETGNGTFIVNLFMGNGFGGTSTPGTRVFDVTMEGNLVIDNKDLSAEYGHQVGAMETYQVEVIDGILNIEFIHQTENPLINAIEILGAGGTVVNPPITIDPIANQVNDLGDTPVLSVVANGGDPNETFGFVATGLPPGLTIEPTNGSILGTISTDPSDANTYAVSVTVDKPSSISETINFSWTVLDPANPSQVLFRVNAGGPLTASNDSSPSGWEEDQAVTAANGTAAAGTPSQYVNSGTEDITFGAALPGVFVNNTGYPNNLFSTERYNTSVVPNNMQWDFPVTNGTYIVNLIFAEIWTGAQNPGIRVFDVQIEGNAVLTNFDQTASYGWATAGVETFNVTVNDGNLDIDFIQGVQNPNIKAIEILSSTPPALDQWTNITNSPDHTPRHENSFVQAGDKFYLFGGRESSDKMDIYDYENDSWSTAASTAPFEFNHFQALEYEGLIWVIGSFKDNNFPNETPSDNIFMYDPVADTWIEGPAIPNSRKRGSAGLVMYNNKFYIIAGNTDGHDGGYIPWFDEFDPATGTWTPLTDAPNSRDHFHATVVGNKLYVAGGRLSGGTGGTFAPLIPEVDVYDFGSSSWSTLAGSNLPNARAASSTVTFQGDIVVIGGEGGGQAYTNVDALDVSTGNWTSLAPLNNARHGTQAIVSGSGIWITSGSPNQGGGNQTNMEVYGTDNPSGTPISVGSLNGPAGVSIPVAGSDTFIIDNSGGNQGIYVTNLGLSGANSANFNILSSTSFLVPAGGSSTIEIEHIGAVEGETASLTISYNGSSTSNVDLTSGQAPSAILYRVNTGGTLITDIDATKPDWSPDQNVFGDPANSQYLTASTATGGLFDQSNASAYQGPIDMTDPSLPPGTPSSLFQTERFDAAALPEMTWAFPVTPGAEIEVRLYFAELFTGITAAGQRVFDVSIEGTVPAVFDDIDPYADGGGELKAFMVSHTLTVNDNSIDLVFVHGVENPAVKAIEILEVSGSGPLNTAPLVTNPGIQQSIEGDVITLPVIATDDDLDECGDITFSATGLPPNLNINPTTGLITGTLLEGSGTGTAGAFIEEGGWVTIEAETDFVDTAGGWNYLDESGDQFLVASTDHFGDTNGETVTYNMQITTPGVYRFYMRSAYSGSVSSDENDTWFKIENTSDVHFFCVQGSSGFSSHILDSTTQFEEILLGNNPENKNIYYPSGNSEGRPNFSGSNPGVNGYFKLFRTQTGGFNWVSRTIDNNSFPVYAYFPNPGTFTISMSERSAGHKIDRFVLAHIDDVSTNASNSALDSAPESQQAVGGTPGAADNSPYNVTVTAADNCTPSLSSQVEFLWNVADMPGTGNPEALVEITPGGNLGASTFGGSSLQVTNTSTGNVQITGITIDISTGILPDNVFDPVGAGGDATASCLTANSGATTVGFVAPADPCVDPFTQPRNGGYDIMGLSFTDFDPSEKFDFTVDVDPNSIQGVPGAGGAGAVSGFELIGATITITFSDGSTVVSSLYEDGSLGGGQAVVAPNALATPSIAAVGIPASPSCVETANQTIEVSGPVGANVSLLLMDSRLYIQSGAPPFNVPDETYYANEAMAKALYTGVIGPGGTVEIPVTLLETVGATGTPNGGLNYIVAVVSNSPYAVDQQVSRTSNVLVLKVDPPCVGTTADINISATLQSRTDHSGDYSVKLYDVGSTTPVYDLTATADAAGSMTIDGAVNTIAPGTYQIAVKYPNSLQVVQTVTLVAGANAVNMGELPMGDANGDNFVTLLDFSLLASTFNTDVSITLDGRADFNGDGFITLLDFSLLASNFNTAGEEPSDTP